MPRIALNANLPEDVDSSVRRSARNIASIIDEPLYRGLVSADAEGTTAPNTKRLTYQVRNRRGDALLGRFVVYLWLAATAGGGPQAGQTATFRSGTVLETVLGGSSWRVLTDSSGRAVLDVTVAGAANRYLRAAVISRQDSGQLGNEIRDRPRLFGVYLMGNNAIPSPATAGVNTVIYTDVEGFLRHGFGTDPSPEPWCVDQLAGRGVNRIFLLFCYGENAGYKVGFRPASYPGGAIEIDCLPINEVKHVALAGTGYINRLRAAVQARIIAGTLAETILYGGCVDYSSATDNATLDAHSATGELLGATIAYDAQSVLDFTDPASPHVQHIQRLYARGVRTFGESWERRDVPEIQGWVDREAGIMADNASGRPALALANPVQFYTKASLVGGQRIGVLVANNGPTAAERVAIGEGWLNLGYDLYMDFGGLSNVQIDGLIAVAAAL